MNIVKSSAILVLTLAAISSASLMPAEAASSSKFKCTFLNKNTAQCQCQNALRIGTRKVLIEFLRRYSNANTVCNAQASSLKLKALSPRLVPVGPTITAKQNNGFGNGDEGNCSGGGCGDSSNPGGGKKNQ